MADDDELGPARRRRLLGRQLRDLRRASEYRTLELAAKRSGLSTGSISRIENGKQVILPRTVTVLCVAYGVGQPMLDHLLRLTEQSEDRGWLVEYSATVPNWFSRYLGEEADASEIWTWQNSLVPGLCQTDDYARAIMVAARPNVDPARIERDIEVRRHRQERLTADERPVQFRAIVDEAALRRPVGGPEVMRAQLVHLAELDMRDNVTIRILPFAAGAHAAMVLPFSVLHFSPSAGEPTIYEELYGGAIYPDGPAELDRYTWMWDQLRDLALSSADSLALLTTLAEES
jgi:transcriptional regulator with XRE-family HTH domain